MTVDFDPQNADINHLFLIHRLSFRIWKGIFNISHTFDEPANFTPFWNDWTRSNFIEEEGSWLVILPAIWWNMLVE